ncbi:MAG: hypothetical protein P8020_08175 [Acidobacteriota bacterium]|jgi:hypothetical protein
MYSRQLIRIGIFLCLFHFSSDVNAASGQSGTSPAVFLQESGTEAYRAVFAQYLAVLPDAEDPSLSVDCAISISNVCAAPSEVAPFIGGFPLGAPDRGRIIMHLYGSDGTHIRYVTGPDSPGVGLEPDGELAPGGTWRVRLAEVLAHALGVPEADVNFQGYGWILSGFDCLAGTYNNTVFGVGFTQSYEMVPAMGQGGFFGGVMIPH